MADRVIIVGASRHGERVPIGELKQMSGRAGRGHEQNLCTVDFVVEESDEEYVREGLESEEQLIVTSVLSDENRLVFHVLPEIVSGRVCDIESANRWYSRSFSAFSGHKVDFTRVFSLLLKEGAAIWDGDRIEMKALGEIACSYYFHPSLLRAWMDNFSMIFEFGLESNDVAVAWALGNVDGPEVSGSLGNHRQVVEDCRERMNAQLEVNDGCLMRIVMWWNVLGGPSVGPMRHVVLGFREDFDRIVGALNLVDVRVAGWKKLEFFRVLKERARKAIPSELSSLFEVSGMTKAKAYALYSMGITTKEEAEEIGEDIDDLILSEL